MLQLRQTITDSDVLLVLEPEGAGEIGPLFLANFVHQIVNPLNGVIGTLDNITDGTYRGEEVSRAQLEQCVSLLRNLAYLSDYFFETSGKDSLKSARLDAVSVLPQVIIEALQFFQVSAGVNGMKIELDDSKTQYKIAVRPELVRQVFMNIFDNWLKYGTPNQTVHVIPSVNRRKELIIEIAGRSVGFDYRDSKRLFDLSFRAKQAEEKIAQGSGMGLYICREIIEKQIQGAITATHSRTTGVSTFPIMIPEARWRL